MSQCEVRLNTCVSAPRHIGRFGSLGLCLLLHLCQHHAHKPQCSVGGGRRLAALGFVLRRLKMGGGLQHWGLLVRGAAGGKRAMPEVKALLCLSSSCISDLAPGCQAQRLADKTALRSSMMMTPGLLSSSRAFFPCSQRPLSPSLSAPHTPPSWPSRATRIRMEPSSSFTKLPGTASTTGFMVRARHPHSGMGLCISHLKTSPTELVPD